MYISRNFLAESVHGGWLTLNRACNFRCQWCYAAGTEFDTKRNMDPLLAHKLIDVMSELGAKSVVFIGGEPTLYPQLDILSRHALNAGLTPMLVSNGVRFSNKEFCEKIVGTGLYKLTISVKGSSQEQYVRLTQTKGFTKMLEGVKNLREMGIEPAFEMTLVKEYLPNLEEMFETLGALGIKQLSIDLASPVIVGEKIDTPGVPNPFELRDAIHRIYHSVDTSKIDYVIYMTIPFCLLDPIVLNGLRNQDRLMSSCHVPHGNALIFDEVGKILPCNHMESHSLGQWGIDFESAEELMQYWNSIELQSFRSTCSCYPAEPCKTCPYWQECGGGCMIKWLFWNPAKFIQGSQKIISLERR